MEHEDNNISDEILNQAKLYINELLKNKRLRADVKAQLEIQSYFLMFLAADHEKVARMYPFFKGEIERREKWARWVDKLQWVIIPLVVTGILTFLGQFIYVWSVVIPELLKK